MQTMRFCNLLSEAEELQPVAQSHDTPLLFTEKMQSLQEMLSILGLTEQR